MKKLILYILISCGTITAFPQSTKTELYDLIDKLLSDSTGYENVGDWAVGEPKKFPVIWKADKLEMSPGANINFYHLATQTSPWRAGVLNMRDSLLMDNYA